MHINSSSNLLFAEFYQNSFKGVFRFFYYKSVRFDTIDELCQEAYMRFWQNFQSKLEDPVQCKKIIYGICLNVYREWVRDQIKHNFIQLESYWEELADDDNLCTTEDWEEPEYEDRHEELKTRLKQAIEQLPAKQKEVLILKYIDGLTRKEIANKLQIPQDQVYTYQKRAVKSLKEIIDKQSQTQSYSIETKVATT